MAPNRVILMSCGSYNPPTNMHLRMFEIARDHLHRMGTHVVVGAVISPVNDSYAKKELASTEHRCAMIKLATKSNEWIRLSTWETRQNNWTRTRVSLQHHQNLLNEILLDSSDMKNDNEDLDWIPENVRNGTDKTPIQIKLLCGADLLESFGKPGLWAEEDIDAIVGQHGLVVITREGSSPNKFIYDSDILSKHMHNIFIVTEWIPNEVSSTRIRRALKRGESVRYLIQDSVIEYIYNNRIYDAKETSINTKFERVTNDTNNYLNIDDKYQIDFLTPSPSDVIMMTPSPVEIIPLEIGNKLIKSLQNFPNNTNKITEYSNKNSPTFQIIPSAKTTYPGQAKQIIATESGESLICEVGSHNNSTNTDKNAEVFFNNYTDNFSFIDENICDFNDGNCQVNDEAHVEEKSINKEESTGEDSNSSKNKKSTDVEERTAEMEKEMDSSQKDEDLPMPITIPKVQEENSDRPVVYERVFHVRKPSSSSTTDEIDGKYLKSIVNSRKSLKEMKNLEQVVPMSKEGMKTSNESVEIGQKSSRDFRKAFQGSLDSINSKKSVKSLDKKSRSFEIIRGDFLLNKLTIKDGEIDLDNPNYSQENSPPFITANEEEVDEFCSVCFSKDQSIKNLCTLRSNNSSPNEPDSTECDICTSCNLQDTDVLPAVPQCELCEICGDVALDEDVIASSRPEPDDIIESKILSGSNHLPLNLSKRNIGSGRVKIDGRIFGITDEDDDVDYENDLREEMEERKSKIIDDPERPVSTSIEEFSGDDDSTLNDVEFEIENCGLESDEERTDKLFEPENKVMESMEKIAEVDENMTTTETEIFVGNRMNRGSSMINRMTEPRRDSKRRYKSVDNLPNPKQNLEKVKTKENKASVSFQSGGKFVGSVDNIRIPRPSRIMTQLRRSADDVGKIKEVQEKPGEAPNMLIRHQSERNSRITSDTIEFIFSKHGIKVISDTETAL